ncbi:MAG: MarR family transcriptional regulator [Chloroflexi bacterium]|nr:MarR family transcriptional regulator [Chloroflexota bacterium]
MTPELDEARLAVWRRFLEAHATVIRKLERDLMDQAGVPLSWYDVLVHLSEAPAGSLRHQVLADSLLLSRSGVTRLVDRMVDAGLVCREASAEDRRVSYVVLTEKGRDTLDRAGPGHIHSVVEHFARHLRGPETAALDSFFTRLLEEDPPAGGEER